MVLICKRTMGRKNKTTAKKPSKGGGEQASKRERSTKQDADQRDVKDAAAASDRLVDGEVDEERPSTSLSHDKSDGSDTQGSNNQDDDEQGNDTRSYSGQADTYSSASASDNDDPLDEEDAPNTAINSSNNNSSNTINKDSKPKAPFKLSLNKSIDYNKQLQKRGVVYIARIPPRMNPAKVKQLLSDFEITRVYLVEEDAAKRKRRRLMTGNGCKRYTEGWIEFAKKKEAKLVAHTLNNTRISHVKRNFHYDDLWNLKYLSKFQWSHLTEKVAYERRVRDQRLRLETLQAKKESAAYKQLVETGKKIDMIEKKKRERAEKRGEELPAGPDIKRIKSNVPQIKPIDEGKKESTSRALLGSLV
jgi:ESF2/ABP1 family protein